MLDFNSKIHTGTGIKEWKCNKNAIKPQMCKVGKVQRMLCSWTLSPRATEQAVLSLFE